MVPPLRLRSPHDREIGRLALPALGALATEPLYLLADTVLIGHLGERPLAALALAGIVLTVAVSLCNFLAYGTTAQVARRHGAGRTDEVAALGVQALWLALAIGLALMLACLVFADPLVALLGGEGETAQDAADFLRIASLGVPFVLVSLAGQGWLRGIGNLTSPFRIVALSNLANVVLSALLVYPLGVGFLGSAIGTAVAQVAMGVAFWRPLWKAGAGGSRAPDRATIAGLARMGGHLLVRTGSLLAAFTFCSAVAARIGDAALGAHQIAFQLFVFLALILDALAIAGQVIVGRALGAGDALLARAAATRMLVLSLAFGCLVGALLLAGHDLIPRAFTGDDDVLARAADLWPLFVLIQPLGGLVFALDGILIGAGDSRYLAFSMVAAALCCAPLALAALELDWGIEGVWWALLALMIARLVTLGLRFRGERWVVVGA